MPIGGFNLVEGDAAVGSSNREQGPTPSWAPAWLPSKPSLDYLITLASFTFLALGSLYFLGVRLRPVRVAVQAKQELGV